MEKSEPGSPLYDQMRLSAEIRARVPPRLESNAIPLSKEEHEALMARFRADVGAFERWRTSREMHQAAERAAHGCATLSKA